MRHRTDPLRYRLETAGLPQDDRDNLPIHLEAGALAQDPRDAGALYAVYSLTPYSEVWRTAIEARNLMRRPDPMSLAGRIGLSLLAIVAGALLARFLVRARLAEPRGS